MQYYFVYQRWTEFSLCLILLQKASVTDPVLSGSACSRPAALSVGERRSFGVIGIYSLKKSCLCVRIKNETNSGKKGERDSPAYEKTGLTPVITGE